MTFRVFWDVSSCSYVEVDRRFRGAYCLHHQGYDKPVRISETSENFNVNTQRYIPEDSKSCSVTRHGDATHSRTRH
jgi:hypothetical protein